MNKKGPIIVIEDDVEDRQWLSDIFNELAVNSKIIFFQSGESALDYLIKTPTKPFLILSDIKMQNLGGLELREKIHTNEDLALKCIPFLFFTTYSEQDYVIDAYSNSAQGFFIKPHSFEKLKKVIKIILDYWNECEAPEYEK